MASTWEGNTLDLDAIPDLSQTKSLISQYENIVITGASGWLGKETADLLFQALRHEFATRVTLISSIPTEFVIGGIKFRSKGWQDFVNLRKADLLIHFAFLNQHKAAEVGFARFIEINQNLTNGLINFVETNPKCSVLMASSGAVEKYPSNLNSGYSMEIYSALKRDAEERLLHVDELENAVCMRIWNITGTFFQLDAPYAIIDFAKQVIQNHFILLKGNSNSSRMFANAKEMMFHFLSSLARGGKQILNSGGHSTSIGELALQMLTLAGLSKNDVELLGEHLPPSIYLPETTTSTLYQPNVISCYSSLENQTKTVYESFLHRSHLV